MNIFHFHEPPQFTPKLLGLRSSLTACSYLAFLILTAACSKGERALAAEVQTTQPSQQPAPAVLPRASSIKPSEVLLPKQLATVRARLDVGRVENMVFLIGEDHVSLDVQRAEVDLLGYLVGAYNVKTIYSEGFDQPLPSLAPNQPLLARRAAARDELDRRQITAVEYAATAYPGVQLIGVEDMKLYNHHKDELNRLKKEFEISTGISQWTHDFIQHMGGLKLNKKQESRLSKALAEAGETCDNSRIFKVLGEIVPQQSSEGQHLAALMARKRQIEIAAHRKTGNQIDSPMAQQLLEDRNKAMAANALRYLNGLASTDPVVLVVGSLHIPGLEQDLRKLGIPYVSVLVAGIRENLHATNDKTDLCVYTRLDNGQKTALENALLARRKPPLASFRESFRDKTEFLSVLANADLMLRRGASVNQVIQTAQNATSNKVKIEEAFPIKDGYGLKMRLDSGIHYAYFGSQPSALSAPTETKKLEEGKLAGRYYVIYVGGDGGKPPIPPIHGASMEPNDNDPDQRLKAVFAARNQKNRRAVTVRFYIAHNEIMRQVDDLPPLPLGITRKDVAEAVAAFQLTASGPAKLFAAQTLARMLLVGIDEQVKDDKTRIQQVSENDLLHGLSLPFVAQLANETDSRHFSTMNGVTTVPWRIFQKDPNVLARPVPPARPGSTLFWLDDRLTATPEGARVRDAIAARGIRVNQAAQHGDSLILLGTKEGTWSVTLNDGRKISTGSDDFHRAVSSAESVFDLNVKSPGEAEPVTEELRIKDLTNKEVLETGEKVSELVEKNSGEDSVEELLRKTTEGDPAKVRAALRDHDDLKKAEQTLGTSFKVNAVSMTSG